MLAIVEAFLPEAGQWLGLAAMLLVLALFAGLGRIRGDDDDIPGVSFLRGWSVFAAVMTIVGVFGGGPFSPVYWGLWIVGLALLIWNRRAVITEVLSLRAVFVLGLPLILILAGKAPSEVDSFTHWLPNGLFIFEADRFLRADGPPIKA